MHNTGTLFIRAIMCSICAHPLSRVAIHMNKVCQLSQPLSRTDAFAIGMCPEMESG